MGRPGKRLPRGVFFCQVFRGSSSLLARALAQAEAPEPARAGAPPEAGAGTAGTAAGSAADK
eukprot:10560152-Alexandrium_andersonii.AAC.1